MPTAITRDEVNSTTSDHVTTSKSSSPRCMTPWQAWVKLCYYYNLGIQSFFEKFANFISGHPYHVLGFCLVVTAALAAGFVFMEVENRTEKLYIPQESESLRDIRRTEALGFYRPRRMTEVILQSDVDILSRRCFQDLLYIHNITTNIDGYKDLCLSKTRQNPVNSPTECINDNPLGIFGYSSDNFENITVTLNNEESRRKLKLDSVLGGIERDALGKIQSAKAMRLMYYIKGTTMNEVISEVTLDWEARFLKEMRRIEGHLKCGKLFFTTGRSLDDAISETVSSDTKLISLTFTIMITFACIMLSKFRNPLTGHGLLAMAGTLAVGLGIVTGFGLAMYCQIPFTSIVGVLPFLIVGVGIDDMFIIVDELDRTDPALDIPHRLSKLMKEVGPAITMTTMTDLLAFMVGTTSLFPSITYFCAYAALAITFAYLNLITIFVVFTVFDCRRMKAGRRDMIPCLRAPPPCEGRPPWDTPQPQTSNKIMSAWAKLIMKPYMKAIIVVLSLGLLAIGVYGAIHIDEEFDRRQLAKDGSEFIQYLNALEQEFVEDIPVDVVLETTLDYSDPLTERNLTALAKLVTDNSYYRPYMISWFDNFKTWSTQSNRSNVDFMDSLQQFLLRFPRFRDDILFTSDNKSIKSSRLHCFIKQTTSSVTLSKAMTTLRDDVKTKSQLPAYTSSNIFIFFEQFISTFPETIRNLLLAGAAILLVTMLFLVNPLVVMLVLFAFASLIFELLGLMYVWDVSLNSISMINLVMAIGFAVDYSAHIAHFFVFSDKATPDDRVIDSLETVGASVFMGGFSTFLGMVVTAFASAAIFRIFFKMFFGIVLLGLLHGLCFLPVWMALVCRWNVVVGFRKDTIRHSASYCNNVTSPMSNHEASRSNPVVNIVEAGTANQRTEVTSV